MRAWMGRGFWVMFFVMVFLVFVGMRWCMLGNVEVCFSLFSSVGVRCMRVLSCRDEREGSGVLGILLRS